MPVPAAVTDKDQLELLLQQAEVARSLGLSLHGVCLAKQRVAMYGPETRVGAVGAHPLSGR